MDREFALLIQVCFPTWSPDYLVLSQEEPLNISVCALPPKKKQRSKNLTSMTTTLRSGVTIHFSGAARTQDQDKKVSNVHYLRVLESRGPNSRVQQDPHFPLSG